MMPAMVFLFAWLSAGATAQSTCPAGKTNVGCSPSQMDAYGCCPIQRATTGKTVSVAPTLPKWGQRSMKGQCAIGLTAGSHTGGMCCWPGQSFNGVTCVGTPQCPAPYVAKGHGCDLGSCAQGMLRAEDGLHCCWPGQTFSLDVGTCIGTAQCPSGTNPVGNDCARPAVTTKGKTRAPTMHATLGSLQWIPAGAFRMGPHTPGAADATPHDVELTRGFWMTKSEVTQGMWLAIHGENPAWFDETGPSGPVEDIDWFQAVKFANAVSQKDGLTPAYTIAGTSVTWNASADGWRLPTEAEWEYAARGGRGDYAGGGGWHRGNSDGETHPVCQLGTNGFGLCDMDGNVWEWVWDFYAPYSAEDATDPSGPAAGSARVRRGGAWSENPGAGLVFARGARAPGGGDDELGFRLVRFAP